MEKVYTMSIQELLDEKQRICADPKNKNPESSFFIYTKSAMRKLEKIDLAIYQLTKPK